MCIVYDSSFMYVPADWFLMTMYTDLISNSASGKEKMCTKKALNTTFNQYIILTLYGTEQTKWHCE